VWEGSNRELSWKMSQISVRMSCSGCAFGKELSGNLQPSDQVRDAALLSWTTFVRVTLSDFSNFYLAGCGFRIYILFSCISDRLSAYSTKSGIEH
jgi:hypothetical protein